MMHPIEDAMGWECPETCLSPNQDDKEVRRASWIGRTSNFRSRLLANNSNIHKDQDLILSPESNSGCDRSPPRKPTYARLSSPTPALSSPLLLRESLLRSIPEAVKQHYTRKYSSKKLMHEGIDDVYENVEKLLEVLRMERHQEKLRADEEIKQLKEKLAIYENQKGVKSNMSTVGNADMLSGGVHFELVESLMGTLALLEEECAEWQNTAKSHRQSLGNVTNQLSPSPQKPHATSTPPYKTPRQKNIEKSIQRLREASNQLLDQSRRKSLKCTFDKAASDASDDDEPLAGLRVLEDHQPSETASSVSSREAEDDMPISEPTLWAPGMDAQASTNPQAIKGRNEGDNNALEDEVHYLRQQLWSQMLHHNSQVQRLKEEIETVLQENEHLNARLETTAGSQDNVNAEAMLNKKRVMELEKACQDMKAEATQHESAVTQYQLQVATLESFSKDLMETSCNQLHVKDRELLRAKTDLMILQERLISEVARAHCGRNDMPTTLHRLQQKISDLELQLIETERQHLDTNMECGIERHSRLAMSIKLETTRTKLEKQAAIAESLREQLEASKRMTRAYSSQVEYLSDELQRAQMEARESLDDRNLSMQQYRMDILAMRDDLNDSFCRL